MAGMASLERRLANVEARLRWPCPDAWHATVRPRIVREPPELGWPGPAAPEGADTCPTCGEARPTIVIEYGPWPPGAEPNTPNPTHKEAHTPW